jgi:hypothetical protein
MINIIATCPKCGGAGINLRSTSDAGGNVTTVEYDCDLCGGTGVYESGTLALDEGYFFSTEIFEATALNEYKALNADEKAMYDLILSMGIVNLSDGSEAKSELWDIFGRASTTRANLISLIS